MASKEITNAWVKALDGWKFAIRRLSTKDRAEIAQALAALMVVHGQEKFNEGWNRAISSRQTKAAPASASAAPVTVMPSASPDVHVHVDPGAIVVRNVMPSDLTVRVQTEPTETRLIRDESGNISGAVTS